MMKAHFLGEMFNIFWYRHVNATKINCELEEWLTFYEQIICFYLPLKIWTPHLVCLIVFFGMLYCSSSSSLLLTFSNRGGLATASMVGRTEHISDGSSCLGWIISAYCSYWIADFFLIQNVWLTRLPSVNKDMPLENIQRVAMKRKSAPIPYHRTKKITISGIEKNVQINTNKLNQKVNCMKQVYK